jgi:hypothetical protein
MPDPVRRITEHQHQGSHGLRVCSADEPHGEALSSAKLAWRAEFPDHPAGETRNMESRSHLDRLLQPSKRLLIRRQKQ